MRPLRVLNLQQQQGTDFVADCVLDLLSDFPKATPTQTIVDECHKDKVSSAATTHKKINLLKKLGLVEEFAHPQDKDKRKCYIKVSDKGMSYLKDWEGASK
jgi:Fe2+ or Zn2+ uptake regulation protein